MATEMLQKIWPEWRLGKRIGGGAYGVVYEATRNEYGVENHAAIKIISVPADESEVDTLQSEGFDLQATQSHFKKIVDDCVNEIQIMISLEGHPNIVNVKDYKVVEKADGFGWHIFILMELLTPFATYTCGKPLSESDVIRLGCDICTALEPCERNKIIHRDIKPGNILVHKSGAFKLGDFGIARKLDNIAGGLTRRYTPKYMAPEFETMETIDHRADLYSLGIVLYEQLNNNRIPFQENRQISNLTDIPFAVQRRNKGEAIPKPCNASPAMADLILRACAHDPNMRFASATEMKQALLSVENGRYQMVANDLDRTWRVNPAPANLDGTSKVNPVPAAGNQKAGQVVNTFGSTPKKNNLPKIIAAILAMVILGGTGFFFVNRQLEIKAEIESIMDSADTLANANDFVGAIVKIEAGLDTYPDSNELDEKRSELIDLQTDFEISSIIDEAEKCAANTDYEAAITKIETGLAEYPDASSLQSKLTEYTNALATQAKVQTLADASTLADAGEYESAMSLIKAAEEVYGSCQEYDEAYATYHKAYSLAAAAEYADSGDYASAITFLSEAQKINMNDVELITAYNTYCDNYVKFVLAEADSCYAEWKINDAITVIRSGLKVLPDNPTLNSKLDELNDAKPISITSLTSINSSKWKWDDGIPKDPFGNDYSGACNFVVFHNQSSTERSVEYRTYGKYRMLTGVIAPHADIGEKITCTVLAYADDNLVYSSPSIAQKTDSVTFAVDISGAEYVKVVVRFSDTNPWDVFVDRLIISEVQLWPN